MRSSLPRIRHATTSALVVAERRPRSAKTVGACWSSRSTCAATRGSTSWLSSAPWPWSQSRSTVWPQVAWFRSTTSSAEMILTRFAPNPERAVGALCVGFVTEFNPKRFTIRPRIAKCVYYDPNKVYPFILADGTSWCFVRVWFARGQNGNSERNTGHPDAVRTLPGVAWAGLRPSVLQTPSWGAKQVPRNAG